MNSLRDLDTLADVVRDRQANMRSEARLDAALRGQTSDGEGSAGLKLVVALVGAVLAALLLAQAGA